MHLTSRPLSTFVLAVMLAGASVTPSLATIVRFQTSLGNVDVRLYNAATPLSVNNFLNYVTSNRYSNTC